MVGVTNSSGVSNWIDQSPNNLTGTQANANNRPALITNDINFNASIDFQGNPYGSAFADFDYLDFGPEGLGLTDKLSVFYVGNIDRSTRGHYVIGKEYETGTWRFGRRVVPIQQER